MRIREEKIILSNDITNLERFTEYFCYIFNGVFAKIKEIEDKEILLGTLIKNLLIL